MIAHKPSIGAGLVANPNLSEGEDAAAALSAPRDSNASNNSQLQISVAPGTVPVTLEESVEDLDADHVNENAILFHVVCGNEVGEEFLVHADCTVGAMMDFIKRRLMEDMSLPVESRIELFDENGKSLKIHRADPLERGTLFVKQRGVYFPMYFIPETVDPEFDEREGSQSSGDENEFDALYSGEWAGESSIGTEGEEELIELHEKRKTGNSSESNSSQYSELDDGTLIPHQPKIYRNVQHSRAHKHHLVHQMYAITEDQEEEMPGEDQSLQEELQIENEVSEKPEEDQENGENPPEEIQEIPIPQIIEEPYGQEYPGEFQPDYFPVVKIPPVNPADVEVSSPDSSSADDDEFFDQMMRDCQEEFSKEAQEFQEELHNHNHIPSIQEFHGEGYDEQGDFLTPLAHKDPSALALDQQRKKEENALRNGASDSEETLDVSEFSKSSSSEESEESDSQLTVDAQRVVLLEKKEKRKKKDWKEEDASGERPRLKTNNFVHPLGVSESALQSLTNFNRVGVENLEGSSSEQSDPTQEHRTIGSTSYPRVIYVPIIAETFEGCVKVCKWVVDVHNEIDRGVKDMEHMINEVVASQENQFALRKKENKAKFGSKDKDKKGLPAAVSSGSGGNKPGSSSNDNDNNDSTGGV